MEKRDKTYLIILRKKPKKKEQFLAPFKYDLVIFYSDGTDAVRKAVQEGQLAQRPISRSAPIS